MSRLTDIEIDSRGLRDLTMGPQMRSLVREGAEQIEAIYRATVAKRTGTLARETRVETFVGGREMDRWCARVIAYAPYAAAHEFGYDRQRGHHELRKALEAWEKM